MTHVNEMTSVEGKIQREMDEKGNDVSKLFYAHRPSRKKTT